MSDRWVAGSRKEKDTLIFSPGWEEEKNRTYVLEAKDRASAVSRSDDHTLKHVFS